MNSFAVILPFVLSVIEYCVLLKLEHAYLQCRDNEGVPLDWWYLYKPPVDLTLFFDLKFSFITPDSSGRWEPSDKYLTSDSMLQHTLAPIFRQYNEDVALVIYVKRDTTINLAGSLARGVLMADETGGVWLYHTVPGLVNIKKNSQSFPLNESLNGHLLMCMTLDLVDINEIFRALIHVYPKITYFRIPQRLQRLLPEWNVVVPPEKSKTIESYRFTTRDKSLRIEVLYRTPGNRRSLYKNFASNKNIVLDVYEHRDSEYGTWICSDRYSVRSIEHISLKYPESVLYINNKTDEMRFAVSTAAHWQQLGRGPPQYWACISNLDNDGSSNGGDLLCVENYMVWHAFDNFKVKEPLC
ncbi:unnamed protein product [Euphydryas editha]|uniref:Plancitoxin-1 n=1 Tax=Euphydryas editha TaxID=104508 RepID=A0AAU9TXT3_EUPED|nr:unnamed protein product [Euphydryas editha]